MRKGKSVTKVIASLILLVILSPFLAVILKLFADAGIFVDIWFFILDAIPFSNIVAQLAIKIFTTVVPEVTDLQRYLDGLQQITSGTMLFQEFCKLCLTALLYGVLKSLVDKGLELREGSTGFSFVLRVLWYLVSAFVSALLAGIVLSFAYDQINQLPGMIAKIFSNIITFIILNGAVYIYMFIFAVSAGKAVGYTMVKLVGTNLVGMITSEVCLTFIILSFSEQAWVHFTAGIGIWLAIIIALLGVDIMLETAFK